MDEFSELDDLEYLVELSEEVKQCKQELTNPSETISHEGS